ncbi:MAG: dihydropteroate synthase, partial [Mariprofundales bacterium]|nr:dihydropteroate synthase [Mariprofundales bacterium]
MAVTHHRWWRQPGSEAAIMGVLNCTPDSFSDGGRFIDVESAVRHGVAMCSAGAAIVDVGGESSRPGAKPVPLHEELERVIPVVSSLTERGCRVAIDTTKAEVMYQAVAAGATMINDISALSADGDALAVAADCDVDICLMHRQGDSTTMQIDPHYHDVTAEVIAYLQQRVDASLAAGISEQRLLVDPGIGFGKTVAHNLQLLRDSGTIRHRLSLPLLIGLSRKSFLGQVTGSAVDARDSASALA